MNEKIYNRSAVICRQGETGNCMYYIRSGSVAVISDYGTVNRRELATLKAGEFFGEMELIENAPRSATVAALEDGTELEVITDDGFLDFFDREPEKVYSMLRQLSARLRKTTRDYLEVCRSIYNMTEQDSAASDASGASEADARRLADEQERLIWNLGQTLYY